MGFDEEKLHCCCFVGHRKIEETLELMALLRDLIEWLILYKKVNTFLFGSRSAFDKMCYHTVSELKQYYPYIKRVYVRGEYPYIDDNYKKYLLQYYEETYFPKEIEKAGKAVYVERNYKMIDSCAYLIVYLQKRPTDIQALSPAIKRSGTKLAYGYAQKSTCAYSTSPLGKAGTALQKTTNKISLALFLKILYNIIKGMLSATGSDDSNHQITPTKKAGPYGKDKSCIL